MSVASVNYRFATEILPKALLKDPNTFYDKYMATDYEILLASLSSAWKSLSDSMGFFEYEHLSNCIDIELSNIYEDGSMALIVGLPYVDCGVSHISILVVESLEADCFSDIDIQYNFIYSTNDSPRLLLIKMSKDMKLKLEGYVYMDKKMLFKKLNSVNKKT